MQNRDFIFSIPKEIIVLSGSMGIKAQHPSFRDYHDIDVCFQERFLSYITYEAEKAGALVEELIGYDLEVLRLMFKDGSTIDMIPYQTLPSGDEVVNVSILGSLMVSLTIGEIVSRKIELLVQYRVEGEKEKFDKHARDIADLMADGIIQIKKPKPEPNKVYVSNEKETVMPKFEDCPF